MWGILWTDPGSAYVSVIQECLGGATQITQLDITVLSDGNETCTIRLDETQGIEKQLVHITDILGREIHDNSTKSILLYIYNDGSVEKKYIFK